MPEEKVTQVTATYDRDSRRFHRFIIDDKQDIAGSIYCPKGEEVPNKVEIILKDKGEE